MNFDELENLKDSQLFDLQNKISDIVRQRNLEKGDLEEIIDNSFNVGFPKVDGLGLNPWIENSLIICPGAQELIKQKQDIFANLLLLTRSGLGSHHT